MATNCPVGISKLIPFKTLVTRVPLTKFFVIFLIMIIRAIGYLPKIESKVFCLIINHAGIKPEITDDAIRTPIRAAT